MRRMSLSIGLVVLLSAAAQPSVAQNIDDVVVGYQVMYLDRAVVGGRSISPQILRQSLAAEVGVGDFGIGLLVQRADPLGSDYRGRGLSETGVTGTVRYDSVLADWLRVQTLARIGLTTASANFSEPLFATDTDVRGNLVLFDATGVATPIGRLFFSAHAGAILNFVGRVQLLGGGGVWWQDWGLYSTIFESLRGVDDPATAGDDADVAYVKLRNAGVSLELSRDVSFSEDRTLTIGLRQNFPLRNGGFDTSLTIQIRWGVFEEQAAW